MLSASRDFVSMNPWRRALLGANENSLRILQTLFYTYKFNMSSPFGDIQGRIHGGIGGCIPPPAQTIYIIYSTQTTHTHTNLNPMQG